MSAPAAWRIRRCLASTLAAVDGVCADVRNRLKGMASPADSFAVELLLREALVNAVEHGCRGRPEGRVRCEVRRRGPRLRISVCDDGPGFDWRRRQAAAPRDTAISGRGVRLYALYTSRVEFNEAGNQVVLFRDVRDVSEGSDDDRTSNQP